MVTETIAHSVCKWKTMRASLSKTLARTNIHCDLCAATTPMLGSGRITKSKHVCFYGTHAIQLVVSVQRTRTELPTSSDSKDPTLTTPILVLMP